MYLEWFKKFPKMNPTLRQKERRTAYLMLAPYLLGVMTLVIGPALLSLGLAFTDFDAIGEPTWLGLTNLLTLLNDRFFWMALGNTLFYVLGAVSLRLVGAFGLALLLHRAYRRRKQAGRASPTQALIYLPSVIPDIAYALIWLVAFNPAFGPVNVLLGWLGLPTPAWLVEAWPARFALISIAVWQLGEGFIILLASLSDIPASLYEMAELDGASAWRRFWAITWPLLLPRLLLLSARDVIITLQANFVPSLVMTKGGPGYATLFLPLYTYQLAFEDLRFGYASAVVWTLYLLTGAIVAGQYWLTRRRRYDEAF
jgi:multiple sugar transport system permease protein